MDWYHETFNPKASEAGVYAWEGIGVYGVEIGVQVVPLRCVTVQIGVGWKKHARVVQTNLYIEMQTGMVDLQGNQYNEEHPFFHGKGMATCAMNTAIQFLVPLYRKPEEMRLIGRVSQVDDLWASPGMQKQLSEKRRIFWKRFGFRIDADDMISCRLSALRCVAEGLMLNEFPRLITPDQFCKVKKHQSLTELFRTNGTIDIRDIIPKHVWESVPNNNGLRKWRGFLQP
jgi:hypothetical protein